MRFTLPTVSVSSLALALAVNGVTIDWTANPEEKILLPQCEDLTFALTGTHDIQNFNKKGRFKQCDFSISTVMLGATTNEDVTMTGQDFLKRKKYYYGCDVVSLLPVRLLLIWSIVDNASIILTRSFYLYHALSASFPPPSE